MNTLNINKPEITCEYLTNLINVQTKDYSADELKYTALLRVEFENIMREGGISIAEERALNEWCNHVFGGVEQCTLQNIVHRANNNMVTQ